MISVGKAFIFFCVLVIISKAFATPLPVQAIGDAYIYFTGTGSDGGEGCTEADLDYQFSVTGVTDDDNGLDWYAIMELDGDGTIQDNDFYNVTVGTSDGYLTNTDFGAMGIANAVVNSRPVVVRLVDIGKPNGIWENDPAGLALTLAGTFIAEDSFDLALVHPECADLPNHAPAEESEPVGAINFGDNRLNPDDHAPVAIYCVGNGTVAVYAVLNAEGVPAFSAPAEQIEAAAADSEITNGLGGVMHKLPDGRLQVYFTQPDGKGYVFIWNGCPATHGESYTVENGVATGTGTIQISKP